MADTFPPMVYPQPTGQSVNWTPPTPSANGTSYVNPNTTTDQIRSTFKITPPATIPAVSNP